MFQDLWEGLKEKVHEWAHPNQFIVSIGYTTVGEMKEKCDYAVAIAYSTFATGVAGDLVIDWADGSSTVLAKDQLGYLLVHRG